jgi:voltage-gated potassium channel
MLQTAAAAPRACPDVLVTSIRMARARVNPIERRMEKFLREPPTVRTAASTIVGVTILVVVASGVLMRVFDHREYSNIWVGMWWALQTVTTVGYGDVTPQDTTGRVIASFVMLEGIALLAIVTAAITSTFVARAAKERLGDESREELTELQRIESRFDGLERQLERIESALRGRGS